VSVVARVILALTLPAGLACAAVAQRPTVERAARVPAPSLVTPPAATLDQPGSDDSVQPDPDASDAVDLYGNQVVDAVAKYKLDATGTLYELHSPQTEIPRLRSPKS
jgi:hypothetical protein